MNDLSLNQERLNLETALINMIKGVFTLAKVDTKNEDILVLAKNIIPAIFKSKDSILGSINEPKLVKEYREIAEAKSKIENKEISPLTLLEKDIEEYQKLVKISAEHDHLKRKLTALQSIKKYLKIEDEEYEDKIIIGDVYFVDRGTLPDAPSFLGNTRNSREFKIGNNKGLKIRMLHPDIAEHATGADLIYEYHDTKKRKIRIVVIQYKIWDNDVIYLSHSNALKQIAKLQDSICNSGYCKSKDIGSYRFPYCSAFFRPTEKIQKIDPKILSAGTYIPICKVAEIIEPTNQGGKKIEKKRIKSKSLSSKLFEELFCSNMIGSDWIDYSDIERFYINNSVIKKSDNIVMFCQEFLLY